MIAQLPSWEAETPRPPRTSSRPAASVAIYATHLNGERLDIVNSGTSALHLAMLCLDVGPGDEVITVPMTFIATVWGILYTGATPVDSWIWAR